LSLCAFRRNFESLFCSLLALFLEINLASRKRQLLLLQENDDSDFINLNIQTKEHYFEELVKRELTLLQRDFEKNWCCREKIVSLSNFDLVQFFEKLIQNYPTAFAIAGFIQSGLWMGCTCQV
jgi:hypothetical protein